MPICDGKTAPARNLRGEGWSAFLKQSLRALGGSLQAMTADRCFTHAAAIAYYMVVSIFPLLLLLIGVLGFFLEKETTQREVLAMASRYFPPGSLRLIRENITSVVEARESLSLLSLAGLLWSATLMFDAINRAINTAWGTQERVRFATSKIMGHTAAFVTAKIKSLLIVSIVILVGIFTTLLTAQAALLERFESFLTQFQWAEWIWRTGSHALALASRILSWSLTVATFTLAYRLLPRTRVSLRDVWLPALLAATIWEGSKRAFVWYVTGIANYSQVYGSISAMLVLMLWAYLSALIVIWGAELAASYARRGANAGDDAP